MGEEVRVGPAEPVKPVIADPEGPFFISCTVERRRYSDDPDLTHGTKRQSFPRLDPTPLWDGIEATFDQ